MKVIALSSVRKKVFLLDLLVLLSKVDGDIHEQEKDLIRSFSYSIGGKEVNFSENYSLKDIFKMAPELEKSEKFVILKKLYELAASDSTISDEEESFISEVKDELNLSLEDLFTVSQWIRSKMDIDKDLEDYISKRLIDDIDIEKE
ncbi:MAG: hypothetical protein GY760_27995 [Deltaproteobacteria bacterium]|nr:hypothetical protein [Deltaproteobacteria bacterium]